jgi:eukaryotic-like serine/threonine-protein kinase
VWRGVDLVLNRPVAVKLLNADLADRLSRVRIRAEAQVAARLAHPNVASVYDFGESWRGPRSRVPYIVMELVDGTTLAARERDDQLHWRTAVGIAAEVAAALAAAHSCGVVHRDIKPGNIMLAGTGVKVVDFGIAAAVGALEEEGELLGTPAYVAPERLMGQPAAPATDVYALGVVLYEALTGDLPWDATTASELITAHMELPPRPMPDIEGLPPDVAELCQQCLAKEPDERPTSLYAAVVLAEAAGVRVTLPPVHRALDTWPASTGRHAAVLAPGPNGARANGAGAKVAATAALSSTAALRSARPPAEAGGDETTEPVRAPAGSSAARALTARALVSRALASRALVSGAARQVRVARQSRAEGAEGAEGAEVSASAARAEASAARADGVAPAARAGQSARATASRRRAQARRTLVLAGTVGAMAVGAVAAAQPWTPAGPTAAGDAAAPATGQCAARYIAEYGAGGAFTAELAITNTGVAALQQWAVAFALPAGQRIVDARGVTWDQDGASVTLHGAEPLEAGDTRWLTLTGTSDTAAMVATGFRLDGTECAIAGADVRAAAAPAPTTSAAVGAGKGRPGAGRGTGPRTVVRPTGTPTPSVTPPAPTSSSPAPSESSPSSPSPTDPTSSDPSTDPTSSEPPTDPPSSEPPTDPTPGESLPG